MIIQRKSYFFVMCVKYDTLNPAIFLCSLNYMFLCTDFRDKTGLISLSEYDNNYIG